MESLPGETSECAGPGHGIQLSQTGRFGAGGERRDGAALASPEAGCGQAGQGL